ncbi:hypothetical protein [Pandoraea terrae]|uniref:hypothetical protein n=1 Tax=Pandoraea terrae TaxID=1537710 RepID=UPI00177DF782|nr:hypothetical protein [Pandoraea terrae]
MAEEHGGQLANVGGTIAAEIDLDRCKPKRLQLGQRLSPNLKRHSDLDKERATGN